ncbi:MAG: hypothetical protein K6T87_14120 [Roseiflexus sp.]|jgi:hypothetical protein|uniref:hypothetical protein n=1 Tax=Roseiflexus sp. TaxID=2562120 RepID=UPI0025CEA6B4|nr:hypothetical protein [Roseiflexus sp.]MCL6541690.1 hypothetical protein [Roseiflexus sp.]
MTLHQQTYRLYLGANQVTTVTLRTDEPLYRIVERLVIEHGLPVVDQYGQPITYALYAGQIRRLSNEMTLRQAGYDQGGDLYLANIYAPWWEGIPAVTRRFGDDPPAPNARRIPYALVGIGAAVALMVVIGGVLLFTIFSGRTGTATRTSALAQQPAQGATQRSNPTATLAPAPTRQNTPQSAPPTATLASTPQPMTGLSTATLASIPQLTTALPTATLASPGNTATVLPPTGDEEVSVAGVKREYLNRDNRLFFQGRTSFGAYLWSDSGLQTKAPASQGNIVVSNGDRVAILSQNNGIAQVRIITNALDPADPKVIGATGYLPAWLITDQNVPPPPTPVPDTGKLWVRKLNEDDEPGCISMRITGINAQGWSFGVDGMNLAGRFDNAGNARLCGLGPDQEVTISVRDQRGRVVPGGRGVPAKGRDIMLGTWQRN